MITVPFFRPSIGQDEINAVSECLLSGWLTTGSITKRFEEQFADFIGPDIYAVAVNSATAALHLGLEALGVGPGDEVIVPTLTFTATAEVVRYLGAKPVFVDIDCETLCISPECVSKAISPLTKVVIPVHFAGRPCDLSTLVSLGNTYGFQIMDDAAHALPAKHNGYTIGSYNSRATAFSFYANKTMTTGEGGMLVTNDPEIAKRARLMRLHGIDRDVFGRYTDLKTGWLYDVTEPGFKYNLTDLASSIGLVQLTKANGFANTRALLASRYDEAFSDLPLVLPPHASPLDSHSWHLYIIQLTDAAKVNRDQFIAAMATLGICTSVHYRPLHMMSVWRPYCEGKSFPKADLVFERCVSLPLFMSMTNSEQEQVIDAVRSILLN